MKAIYFAWVRERIGKTEEVLSPPVGVETVADLIGWLKTLGDGYESAFANGATIRTAIDHAHVKHDAAIGQAREIAFFPPMTGG